MRIGLTLITLLTLASAAIGCGPPSVELEDTFFSVAHTTPHHGAVDVSVDVVPVLAFTHPVDLETVKADGNVLFVRITDDGTRIPIGVAMFPTDDLLAIELVPQTSLDPGVEHRIQLAEAVSSAAGARLAAPFRTAFVTADE